MAEELLGWDLGILRAHGDLSSFQHRFVKISGQKKAAFCAAGDPIVGILQNAPASGRACQIRRMGLSKLDIAATVTAGQKLKAAALGKGTPVASDGDDYGAIALEGGADTQTITVLVEFGEVTI